MLGTDEKRVKDLAFSYHGMAVCLAGLLLYRTKKALLVCNTEKFEAFMYFFLHFLSFLLCLKSKGKKCFMMQEH